VLDVVAGKYGIHRLAGHGRHIGHGANDVGVDRLVNIKTQLSPFGCIEAAGSFVFVLGAAAYMQKRVLGVHGVVFSAVPGIIHRDCIRFALREDAKMRPCKPNPLTTPALKRCVESLRSWLLERITFHC
jgi:hypothetical protein